MREFEPHPLRHGLVAQLAVHVIGNDEVAGSSPAETSNYMVAVAQLVEHQIVALGVASSTLVGHPILPISLMVERPALTRHAEVQYLDGQPNTEAYSRG